MPDQSTPEYFVNTSSITVQFEIHTPKGKPETVLRVFRQFFKKYLENVEFELAHIQDFNYQITAPTDPIIWFHIGGAVRQIELLYQ